VPNFGRFGRGEATGWHAVAVFAPPVTTENAISVAMNLQPSGEASRQERPASAELRTTRLSATSRWPVHADAVLALYDQGRTAP